MKKTHIALVVLVVLALAPAAWAKGRKAQPDLDAPLVPSFVVDQSVETPAVTAPPAAPAPVVAASEPVAPPPAPAPTVSMVVHSQPLAYQCFLGDNPGFAPGRWVEVHNSTSGYFYGSVDDAPLIVLRPTADGSWEPLSAGIEGRTVLPPHSRCYFRAPARLSQAHHRLREYVLKGRLYGVESREMDAQGRIVVRLTPEPEAVMREPRPFTLPLGKETILHVGDWLFK